jgi:hypothetical protein
VWGLADNYPLDSNLTVEILWRSLMTFFQLSSHRPKKLFLQLDNCGRENKNRYLLAYLDRLVAVGVFESIQVSFLPVGHTHEGMLVLVSLTPIAHFYFRCRRILWTYVSLSPASKCTEPLAHRSTDRTMPQDKSRIRACECGVLID